MKESTTYQGILDEGRAEGEIRQARRVILRLGRKRFGKATAAVQAALEGITELERLDRITDAVLSAEGWQNLLETR